MQYSVNTEHFVFWSNGYMFQPPSAQSSGHTTTKGVNFSTVIVVWPDDGPDEGLKCSHLTKVQMLRVALNCMSYLIN